LDVSLREAGVVNVYPVPYFKHQQLPYAHEVLVMASTVLLLNYPLNGDGIEILVLLPSFGRKKTINPLPQRAIAMIQRL